LEINIGNLMPLISKICEVKKLKFSLAKLIEIFASINEIPNTLRSELKILHPPPLRTGLQSSQFQTVSPP
jgi:hypothetical protein